MADKGVINRANDFWLNSKFSWLFQPWGGCCSSKDDEQLQSERSSILPKNPQFLQQTAVPELYHQDSHKFIDDNDGINQMQETKVERDDGIEYNQDWLPEYDQDNTKNNAATNNLIVTQAYPQIAMGIPYAHNQQHQVSFNDKHFIDPELDNNEKPDTMTEFAEYPDSFTEDDMDTESKQSYVPSIERKNIKKQRRPSRKFENKNKSKSFRNPWQSHEDEQLLQLVKKYGYSWSLISQMITGRSGKQVRDRYLNKLNPCINKGKWSQEEDETIVKLFYEKGSKWSEIAKSLSGRTESQVKNRFYSYIRKKFLPNEEGGIDQYSTNKIPNIVQSSQAPNNSTRDGNYKLANDKETIIEYQNTLPMNIIAPSQLPHYLSNQQHLIPQQNQDLLVPLGLPNITSSELPSIVGPNVDLYNHYPKTNNQYENYHNEQDFGHLKFEENFNNTKDIYTEDDYGVKHELLNNGPLMHNLNHQYSRNFQQEDSSNPLPNAYYNGPTHNNNNGFNFMNGNYGDTIPVPNRQIPQYSNGKQIYPGVNNDDDDDSPQYSISSPESNNNNGDCEIDVRLDKLAILFEKNKLNLEELKSLDTMSIVKSNNSSDVIVSEASHPLQKMERIDLLSKRTKKLEYLLAKTYQEIQKISKQKNQQGYSTREN